MTRKGAGAGRTAQRGAAPHENCAPALFWLVPQAHNPTALLIGSTTVTPLVVKHTRFSFSTTAIKTCDLLCMLRLLCCFTLLCLRPTLVRAKNNKGFTGEQLYFHYTCSDIVDM